MSRPADPCVLCSRFHRHANAPPAHGYCEGYERFRLHDDTNEVCVLFNRANDEQRRKAWAAPPDETISRASAPRAGLRLRQQPERQP